MHFLTKIRSVAIAICGVAALVLTAPASAQYGGVVVARGGYYGGYGGYYGYRGWYGGYYPWGWGAVGPGPYFAALPYYYPTYAYGGAPYYYAGNTYIYASPALAQYQIAAQPRSERRPDWSELVVYPKNGQSQYQQTLDKYECYRWAVSQLGYDPTSAGGGTVRRDLTDYNRAQAACLTARGYSVR
jgi:hypothetical protein